MVDWLVGWLVGSLDGCCFLFCFFNTWDFCFDLLLLFCFFLLYALALFGLLPCLTIVRFVRYSLLAVSCTPTAVSEIKSLT